MRILILNQSFHPDIVSVAQHASELGSALAARGHAVTVVASRHAYTDPKVCFPARETWSGCEIRRVRSLGLGKGGKWRRILDSSTLLAAFLFELIRLPRFDVVLAMTHPPMVAALAALVTRIKGGLLVFWVMDLNPDEAIAAGWFSANSLAARLLNRALQFTLHSSHQVIVLDRFMRQRIELKGIPAERLTVIPPWSHDNLVHYDPAGREAFRAAHGLTNQFVVMYSGNLSPVHPLDTLLRAAAELRDRVDIVFCFVGGGNALPGVRAFAEERGLRNIVCVPYQASTELGASLSAADLHTVVMGEAMVGIVHPCKIYNILALGIPILHIGPRPNHIADILDSAGAGRAACTARPGDVGAVTDFIVTAAAGRLGTVAALAVAAAPFSQAVLIPKLIIALELIAETKSTVPVGAPASSLAVQGKTVHPSQQAGRDKQMAHENHGLKEPMKILFAGGCHVVGYPFGEEIAFPTVVQRCLAEAGIESEVSRAGYLKLPHRRRLVAVCRDAAPDVLVLQFGHPELNRRLSTFLLTMLHLKTRVRDADLSNASNLSDPNSFVASRSTLWSWGKCLLDTCLGHPLIDFGHIDKLWDSLLTELRKCQIPLVVLLSPMPCADRLVMHYRRRAVPVFWSAAERWGCEFIDLMDAVPATRQFKSLPEHYHDVFHLGVRAHELVGNVIAAKLLPMLALLPDRERTK